MKEPQRDARAAWNATAPGWAKWEDTISEVVAEPTEVMFEMAGIAPGMRVLDIACGAGSQTLALARRVGREGHVIATDISARMLDYVRRNATDAGLENIDVSEASADALSVGGEFDAAVCRLGLMLFPDPVGAARSARDALAPGARYAALVFASPDRNAVFAETMGIVLKHAGAPMPPPGAPGLFALGADGALSGVLRDAGLEDIETRRIAAKLDLPDAATGLDFFRESAGVLKSALAGLDETGQAAAWSAVEANLARYEANGRFSADLEFKVAGGRRPS